MFDFTDALEKLIRDIARNCPELSHVDADRVTVAYLKSRSPGVHGVYASCQPLRFKGGELTIRSRNRTYAMPRVMKDGREMLYILYFMLPRFMNLDFETKLVTVFHEMYHISEKFDGDIRRFPGRNYAHGHSRKKYNERVKALVHAYLNLPDSASLTDFLKLSFDELVQEYGQVVGTRVHPPRPKPV